MAREKIFTWPSIQACCAVCNRPPLRRGAREYLYRYDVDGPLLCGDRCRRGLLTAPHRSQDGRTNDPRPRPERRTVRTTSSPATPTTATPATATAPILLARARQAGSGAVIDLMAEFLVQRAAGQQACTRDQLVAAGYSAAEIDRLGAAAVARAGTIAPRLRGEGAAA